MPSANICIAVLYFLKYSEFCTCCPLISITLFLRRYYRFLKNDNEFVGEIAYHYDSEYAGYVANVIVFSKFRGNGYGAKGLELLCTAAKGNGITALYDDIAIDNTAIRLFLKQGFYEKYRTKEKIVLKKDLE